MLSANSMTGRQRAGVVLAVLVSLINVPSALFPTPEGEVGPPLPILLLSSLLGVLGLVCCVLVWRGSRGAARALAVILVIGVISTLPAFFVPIPVGLKVAAALFTIASIVALPLIFSGERASNG